MRNKIFVSALFIVIHFNLKTFAAVADHSIDPLCPPLGQILEKQNPLLAKHLATADNIFKEGSKLFSSNSISSHLGVKTGEDFIEVVRSIIRRQPDKLKEFKKTRNLVRAIREKEAEMLQKNRR